MIESIGSNQAQIPTNPAIIASTLESDSVVSKSSSALKSSCQECRLSDLCLAKELEVSCGSNMDKLTRNSMRLRKGEHLYFQGEDFESVYFIRGGFAKSYVSNADGEEVSVSFFFPGEIIGLDGMHDNHHTASIVALQDTFICELPYKALIDTIAMNPTAQARFNSLLSRQIIQEQAISILRGQSTAANQLQAFLLNLSGRYSRIRLSATSFRLPMTRKDIAGCLNLTIETVSRLFSQFQEQNWIEVDGKDVVLLDLPGMNVSS